MHVDSVNRDKLTKLWCFLGYNCKLWCQHNGANGYTGGRLYAWNTRRSWWRQTRNGNVIKHVLGASGAKWGKSEPPRRCLYWHNSRKLPQQLNNHDKRWFFSKTPGYEEKRFDIDSVDKLDLEYLNTLSSSDRYLLAYYDVWMLQKESGVGSPACMHCLKVCFNQLNVECQY